MVSAGALTIFSGKIIYNFGIPERLRTLRYSIFTSGGRNGKRQLQRRFLRKRSAAGLPPQAHYVRQIPPFVAARHLPPAGGSQPSRGRLMAMPETLSPPLKAVPLGKVAKPQALTEGVLTGKQLYTLAGNCTAMPKAPSQRGLSRRSRDWGS